MPRSLSTPVACRIIDMEEGYIFRMNARLADKSFRIISPGITGRRLYYSTLEKPLNVVRYNGPICAARRIHSGLATRQMYYV